MIPILARPGGAKQRDRLFLNFNGTGEIAGLGKRGGQGVQYPMIFPPGEIDRFLCEFLPPTGGFLFYSGTKRRKMRR